MYCFTLHEREVDNHKFYVFKRLAILTLNFIQFSAFSWLTSLRQAHSSYSITWCQTPITDRYINPPTIHPLWLNIFAPPSKCWLECINTYRSMPVATRIPLLFVKKNPSSVHRFLLLLYAYQRKYLNAH